MDVRRPAVAGSFYERDPAALRSQIESCFLSNLGPGRRPSVRSEGEHRIVGLVCPHAGYMFSGGVAAHSYYCLAQDGSPRTFVIIGPNHYGVGAAVAVQRRGIWRTPLGDAKINEQLADEIRSNSAYLEDDLSAHENEHSVEVQVPFLQYLYGDDFSFVPISIMLQTREVAEDLGSAITQAMKKIEVAVIASSDFTHYETHEAAHSKDKKALLAMEELNPSSFLSTVVAHDITACGYGAIATALQVANESKAKCEILKYATSGDVSGDKLQVVGYAAAKFIR